MIRIGIIDDEKEARKRLREEIAKFETKYQMEFEVCEFESAASYLAKATDVYDILYLDIDMPQMTGMELAEKIRETDSEVIIIFCTNFQQFAVNGYSVSALGFMVKPVQWYSFHMYLDRALKALKKRGGRLEDEAGRRVIVKDGAVSRVVCTVDIKYVEVRQHYLLYHMWEEAVGRETVLKLRGTMQEAADLLSPYGFVRCSASFLVNLSRITAVSRMNIHIGQEILPIGRAYKDSFTETFSKYLAKREWEDPCQS